MRLLLLITDLEIGGTPTVVRELALRLRSATTHVEVACLKSMGPVGEQLRAAGVEVTAFDARRPWQLARTTRRVAALVRERRIDTVFSFLVHANVVAALAKRRLPAVRFFQSIQTTQRRPRWHWLAQRFAARSAERIVVPSESVARVARSRSRVSADKLRVIPNAIDADHSRGTGFQPVMGLQAPQHGRDAHATTFRIGFVGRLDPIKRVWDLIEAVWKLDETRCRGEPLRHRLDIWGNGLEREGLETGVAEMDDYDEFMDLVTFHGSIADPREAYANMDVLVLPSDAEGFGLVLIEAMAAGVPVIGTDVDGIRDVIRHEHNGLLVPPRAPAAIASAILRLSSDVALRERLVATARVDVQQRFAWPPVLDTYRHVLGIAVEGVTP